MASYFVGNPRQFAKSPDTTTATDHRRDAELGLAEELPASHGREAGSVSTGTPRSIHGRVLDRRGAPLAGVRVALFDRVTDDAETPGHRRGGTLSDSEGTFQFESDWSADLMLNAELAGFAEVAVRPNADAPTEIRLVPRNGMCHVDGFVTTRRGTPVPAFDISPQLSGASGARAGPTQSFAAPDGRFALHLAIDATHTQELVLIASADGYAEATSKPLVVRDDDTINGVRIELDVLPTRLSGFVVDPMGSAVAGAELALFDDTPQRIGNARSSDGGKFELKSLDAGRAVGLLAVKSGYAPRWVDLSTPPSGDAPLVVELEPGSTLIGTVTGPDTTAVTDVGVRVWIPSPNMGSLGSNPPWTGQARTDSLGQYRIHNVPTGAMFMGVESSIAGTRQRTAVRCIKKIQIVASTERVDFQLPRGVKFRGSIAIPSMPNAALWLELYAGIPDDATCPVGQVVVPVGNRFEFCDIPAGPYTVRIRLSDSDWVDRLIRVESADTDIGELMFKAEDMIEFDQRGTRFRLDTAVPNSPR